MVVTLYEAPLLSAQRRNIITDFRGYLSRCKKSIVKTLPDLTLYDFLRLEVAADDISYQYVQYPSYVKIETKHTVAYYYVENVEEATPSTLVLSLARDYVNPLLTPDTKLYGQLVAGHYPLTVDNVGHTPPVPVGEPIHIKRCRGINGSNFYPWGESAKVCPVFRVVLNKNDDLLDSRVVLIRGQTYDTIDSALFARIYTILSSANRIIYVNNDEPDYRFSYDIEEVTDAWIVPHTMAPTSYSGYHVDFQQKLFETPIEGFALGVPSASSWGWSLDVPTYANVRTFIGNVLNYVELPYSNIPHRVTFVLDYGVDSMLSVTMRVNGKCIDMTPSMDIGTNLFSNSSATLSGKVSRALGVFTGAVSIAGGIATGQPLAIAGGAVSTIQSIAGGIGGRTALGANGADGLQSLYQASFARADSGFAVGDTGPLSLMYFELTNSDDITKTINLFGVNTNVSFFGDVGSFMVNRFQYVKFDNVRILARNLPPQFVEQLTDLLTTGVHVINSGLMEGDTVWIWDGDRHVL